jgi:hypothetical protein
MQSVEFLRGRAGQGVQPLLLAVRPWLSELDGVPRSAGCPDIATDRCAWRSSVITTPWSPHLRATVNGTSLISRHTHRLSPVGAAVPPAKGVACDWVRRQWPSTGAHATPTRQVNTH